MTYTQFEKLVRIISPFIKEQDIRLRDAISVEKRYVLYYIDFVREAQPIESVIIWGCLLQQ